MKRGKHIQIQGLRIRLIGTQFPSLSRSLNLTWLSPKYRAQSRIPARRMFNA